MASSAPNIDVLRATTTDLQAWLAAGRVTSVDLVEAYCAQIEAHNRRGLGLRAVVSMPLREQLRARAGELDQERRDGRTRGPLHGIPVVIKDSIVTHPSLGMTTTAGAAAFQDAVALQSAPIVDQLLAAGLLLLGKSSLTEFCGLRSTGLPAGYSAVNGQTQSPYIRGGRNPDDGIAGHTGPGGSSSGSAVAVAAGFAPISVGTDTVGSIVLPANRAGLYALRLTTASVDAAGVLQLASGYDTVGPMAKTPRELAPLVEVLITEEARKHLPRGGLLSWMDGKWEGLKLGFVAYERWTPLGQFKSNSEEENRQMKEEYLAAIEKLKENGATVVYPIEVPFADGVKYQGKGLQFLNESGFKNLYREFASYFTNAPQTLAELVAWNEEHKDIAMPEPWSSQNELISCRDNTDDPDLGLLIVQHLQQQARDGLLMVFESPMQPVDIIVAPSDCMLVSPVATAGYTAGVVPLGYLETCGQPQGITIAAKAGEEGKLLKFMSAWEATFPQRKVPPQLVQ